MKFRPGPLAAAVFAAVFLTPCTTSADDGSAFGSSVRPVQVSPSRGPETWGISDLTALMIGSFQFQGRWETTTIQHGPGAERYITSPHPADAADATPVLPNGALIEAIELRACDSSATDEVLVIIGICTVQNGVCGSSGSVTTGAAATPGCGNFLYQLPTPLQVDNQHPILVDIATGLTSATTFSGVKLYYRLQVSPAPAVATFSDVPTSHWAFRYVEALAASGITVGVTPTTFEPESPVSRAQMAVFLAKALGLHFPN